MKLFRGLKSSLTARRRKWMITSVIFFAGVYFYLKPFKNQVETWKDAVIRRNVDAAYPAISTRREKGRLDARQEIIVLRYTKYFGYYEKESLLFPPDCSYLPNTAILISQEDPVPFAMFNASCRITYNRKYLEESAALVFHSYDLDAEELPHDRRKDWQIWVYLQQESPMMTFTNLKAYSNIFNWTMSYRRDSDVYHPYGYLVPHLHPSNNSKNLSKPSNNTRRLVAWIVSNCDTASKREYFVYELQKYIPVESYGFCGDEDCPVTNCHAYVASNYKFYLAFENALCLDYVTEKLYKAMSLNVVPVVYGGNGQGFPYADVVPPKSFINAKDFNSPKDLADYLLYLDRNDLEYLQYFEWKKQYQVVMPVRGQWCNLCQRIHQHLWKDPPQVKVYKDLWKWWNYKAALATDEVENDAEKTRQSTSVCVDPPMQFTSTSPGFFKVGLTGKIIKWVRKKMIKMSKIINT